LLPRHRPEARQKLGLLFRHFAELQSLDQRRYEHTLRAPSSSLRRRAPRGYDPEQHLKDMELALYARKMADISSVSAALK
jgi:hypothetical protein